MVENQLMVRNAGRGEKRRWLLVCDRLECVLHCLVGEVDGDWVGVPALEHEMQRCMSFLAGSCIARRAPLR